MNKKKRERNMQTCDCRRTFFNAPPYAREKNEKKELRRSAWGVRLISDFTPSGLHV